MLYAAALCIAIRRPLAPQPKLRKMRAILSAIALAAPSIAAQAGDETFCGRAGGEPAALQDEISKSAGIKEIYRGVEYIAYQDEATQAVFTFSQAAQGPAHPAAICRKPVKEGDSITLQMVILCKGEGESCQRLESDFKLLNAKMEASIRNEAAEAATKK